MLNYYQSVIIDEPSQTRHMPYYNNILTLGVSFYTQTEYTQACNVITEGPCLSTTPAE